MMLILVLTSQINSANDPDYASNLYRDRRKCFYAETYNCLSTELTRVPSLKCCRFHIDDVNNERYRDFIKGIVYDDYTECRAYFASYVSETMAIQYSAIIYEALLLRRVVLGEYIPKMRETINCSTGNMSYEYGGRDYFKEKDIEKFNNSRNSCLLYYQASLGEYVMDKEIISIDQETCENAELLEQTRKANVTCNYMEIEVLFGDGTKDMIKSCYLFAPEALKVNQLNPNIEDTFKDVADQVTGAKGKGNYTEFNVNIYVKGGGIKHYNSEEGIVIPDEESNSGYFKNIIYQVIFFGLILLF